MKVLCFSLFHPREDEGKHLKREREDEGRDEVREEEGEEMTRGGNEGGRGGEEREG